MSFFEPQDQAQKQTRRLLWLFGLAVVAVSGLACLGLTSLVWIFRHPIASHGRIGLMTPLPRNPAGIEGGRLDSSYAETPSHLYFANSDYDPSFNFLSTHPPTRKRVLAIDPGFDGRFAVVDARDIQNAINARDDAYDRRYEESVRRARKQMESGNSLE